MVKLTKKLTVIILAFLMVFAMAGCGGLNVIKEIANINGEVISEGEFKYYLENVKQEMLTEAGLATQEEVDSFWAGDIDGVNAAEVAKNKAMEEAIRVEIANILAKEAEITLDSATRKQIEDIVDQGGDQVAQMKATTGLNEEELIEVISKEQISTLYANHLSSTEPEKFIPKSEDAVAKYDKEYVRVKHIFISKTDLSQQSAEAEAVPVETEGAKEQTPEEFEAAQKALAEEVYKKVEAGEDFEALIAEYNEDPGMEQNPDGYTFTNDSGMVQVFEDAAFALEVGQVSQIVEQPQGWHIIKKYELLTEGEEYTQIISQLTSDMADVLFDEYIISLKDNYKITTNESAIKGIKIK